MPGTRRLSSKKERKDLGDAVAAAQGNIMGQAAANHDEVMEKLRGHGEILQRLDNHTMSGSQLQREATKRKQEELRDKYQAVVQSVGWALPQEPLQSVSRAIDLLRQGQPKPRPGSREHGCSHVNTLFVCGKPLELCGKSIQIYGKPLKFAGKPGCDLLASS